MIRRRIADYPLVFIALLLTVYGVAVVYSRRPDRRDDRVRGSARGGGS